MRISPVMRGARAYALATLVFSLGLSPSYARMGGSAGSPGLSGAVTFSILRRAGSTGGLRLADLASTASAPNRFNRFGFNRFGGNQLFVGGWGWGGWGGFPDTAASEPIIVGDSAPVIINIGVDPAQGDAAGALSGGCVIHKLNYDSNGKYVGERQIPQC